MFADSPSAIPLASTIEPASSKPVSRDCACNKVRARPAAPASATRSWDGSAFGTTTNQARPPRSRLQSPPPERAFSRTWTRLLASSPATAGYSASESDT